MFLIRWEGIQGHHGLQDIFQLLSLGTNTEIVQNGITLRQVVLGRAALLVDSLSNGGEVFIGGGGRSTLALGAQKTHKLARSLF